MNFTLLVAIIASVAGANAIAASTLLNDISTISAGVTTVDNLVAAYPTTGGTIPGALAIHNAAAALVNPINTAASDASNLVPIPMSGSDAITVIDNLNALRERVLRHLQRLILLKPSFKALPLAGVPQIILNDLINLKAANTALGNAIVAATPTSLQSQGTDFFNAANVAFANTIAVYST